MNIMEQAAQWLDSQRRNTLSVPAIYICRDGESFNICATQGRTLFRAENEYGMTIRTESRDFIVSRSELPIDPVQGDLILYDGRKYEVLAPNGEPVWRWSGSQHLVRRIHTKEIGEI